MTVEATLPALWTVVVTAAIDSINPCAIGVLILLVSVLIAREKKKDLLTYGFAYIAAVYVTYLLAGLGLLFFLQSVPIVVTQYISIAVAGIIALVALVEIKDVFWYGQGFSLAIPPDMTKKIHDYIEHLSLPMVIFLGAFVAAVELPCTGAPYLAIILLLSHNFDLYAFGLLMLYNLIFVLPLVTILILVKLGTRISEIKAWKLASRGYMRLAIGLLLIALSWLLILISGGVIAIE
ncbi:MAG: hypothetical protein QXR53_02340 [Candidatus Norongarragalinales archaeon]